MRTTADAVIIGAGFAGASTAYHLGRLGAGRVVLLEKEHSPGLHASGRNAALADPFEEDDALARLAVEGLRFLQEPPEGFCATPLLSRTGTLRTGARADLEGMRTRVVKVQPALAAKIQKISLDEAARRMGALRGARVESALWCEWAGTTDIHALLGGYVRAFVSAGGELRCRAQVVGIRRGREGALEVELAGGERLQTRTVVNAAGAWAGDVGRLAGAARVPLTAYRRHLFQSAPVADVDPRAPFVWDESRDFYFRPESGGLLLSPCDQTPHAPCEPAEDPEARVLLAAKLSDRLPALAGLRLSRGWACLRTFTPDCRYVVGKDPVLEGFFWIAGLGGTGVVGSAGAGRLAAESVMGSEQAVAPMEPLSPRRFKLCG